MLRLNATDLPRFMVCNGSRLMGGAIPPSDEQDDTPQREGTAAHYMATAVFTGQSTLEELVDRKAPSGIYMTGDMAEHVEKYLAAIADHNRLAGGMEIDTTHNYSDVWLIPGRADYVSYSPDHVLRVLDFKYGWRIVEPEMNWTLISHAIAFISTQPNTPNRIDFQIFQPRPYHPEGALRTWSIDYPRLTQLYAEMNAKLCAPADELKTSNHCSKCPALAICPAARLAEMNAIDAADTVYQDDITNELLSHNLDTLNRAQTMIEDRLKAFQELAKHRIKGGQVVDNYSVGMGLGNTRWKDGIDAGILKALTGKDLAKPKLVTPAEAKRQGIDESVIKALTERPTTGIKLERINANKKAQRLFNK